MLRNRSKKIRNRKNKTKKVLKKNHLSLEAEMIIYPNYTKISHSKIRLINGTNKI